MFDTTNEILRRLRPGEDSRVEFKDLRFGKRVVVFTRNQLLGSFLSKMWRRRTGRVFLESRGEGVRKILEGGEAHSERRPVYELFGSELRLTVWGRGPKNDQGVTPARDHLSGSSLSITDPT